MMSRWRPTAIAALGAGLFLVFVAAGAFAIVSLMPAAVAVAPPKGIFLADTAAPGASPALAWTEGRAEPAAVTPPREPPPPAAARPEPAPPPQPRPPARLPNRDMAALPAEPQAPLRPAPRPQAAPQPAPADPRLRNVLTPAEIRRIKLSLRLTAEQEPHWPAVEAVLTEIGAQQMALARAGQNTADAFSGTTLRIYAAARPLIGVLREDQKAQIRNRARAMGLESVASYL